MVSGTTEGLLIIHDEKQIEALNKIQKAKFGIFLMN